MQGEPRIFLILGPVLRCKRADRQASNSRAASWDALRSLVTTTQLCWLTRRFLSRSSAPDGKAGGSLTWTWIDTASIGSDIEAQLVGYTGIWRVPATPYLNAAGAIAAIRHARERQRRAG